MTEPGNDYPDMEPDGLGDLKKIERLPSMDQRPPRIAWGEEYSAMSVEKRLRYAERLAAAMNHAADVLQTERNQLIDLAREQERQIAELQRRLDAQGLVMQDETTRANREKQELSEIVVDVQTRLRQANRRIKDLGG